MTPLAHPNWASGNQNQDIPKVALLVATSGLNRAMAGVPRSLTPDFPAMAEVICLKIFIGSSGLFKDVIFSNL